MSTEVDVYVYLEMSACPMTYVYATANGCINSTFLHGKWMLGTTDSYLEYLPIAWGEVRVVDITKAPGQPCCCRMPCGSAIGRCPSWPGCVCTVGR